MLVPHLVRLTGRRLPASLLFAHAATRKRGQDWAREQVTRNCKLDGVPRVPPRAAWDAATTAREAGATSQLVAATLGHASPAITEAAYTDGGRAQAAQRKTAVRVLEGELR
ncbi:MAG TPA: hypothetical protein VHN14_35360 [Kofleriaceae bacterium]|nr:hypothetical protein [Kofleriaceae bacterium]